MARSELLGKTAYTVCVYRDGSDNDLLDFIDCKNGKVFLTVGTKHVNDYYPVCVFEYNPELLSINQGKESI